MSDDSQDFMPEPGSDQNWNIISGLVMGSVLILIVEAMAWWCWWIGDLPFSPVMHIGPLFAAIAFMIGALILWLCMKPRDNNKDDLSYSPPTDEIEIP